MLSSSLHLGSDKKEKQCRNMLHSGNIQCTVRVSTIKCIGGAHWWKYHQLIDEGHLQFEEKLPGSCCNIVKKIEYYSEINNSDYSEIRYLHKIKQ